MKKIAVIIAMGIAVGACALTGCTQVVQEELDAVELAQPVEEDGGARGADGAPERCIAGITDGSIAAAPVVNSRHDGGTSGGDPRRRP